MNGKYRNTVCATLPHATGAARVLVIGLLILLVMTLLSGHGDVHLHDRGSACRQQL